MTPELIAIIAVGVALGALNITIFKLIEKRLDSLETRITRLEDRVSNLERRQARLEGLLDGIREALFGRIRTGV